MEYKIERYKNCQRFNEQYDSIYQFLLEAEKLEYNEHFHWGRFEWMHAHSYLDEDKLTSIAMFKDENGTIVGLTTYDTGYDDRVYLIHTSSDKMLLEYFVRSEVHIVRKWAVGILPEQFFQTAVFRIDTVSIYPSGVIPGFLHQIGFVADV